MSSHVSCQFVQFDQFLPVECRRFAIYRIRSLSVQIKRTKGEKNVDRSRTIFLAFVSVCFSGGYRLWPSGHFGFTANARHGSRFGDRQRADKRLHVRPLIVVGSSSESMSSIVVHTWYSRCPGLIRIIEQIVHTLYTVSLGKSIREHVQAEHQFHPTHIVQIYMFLTHFSSVFGYIISVRRTIKCIRC